MIAHNAMEIAALATRRYQDADSLRQAILMFLSDRRRAGLGALARGRRGHRKWFENGSYGRVIYELVIDRPPREQLAYPIYDPFVMLPSSFSVDAQCTVTKLPAFQLIRRLPVHCFELDDQNRRSALATMLRDLRREMRKEAR